MLARALSAVGRTFIGAGLLLLLFVAYQLWGTGLHEARAQDSLSKQFDDKLATHLDVAKTASELTPKDTTTSAGGLATTSRVTSTTTTSTTTTSTTSARAGTATSDHATPVDVKPGEALAHLRIPKIGVDKLVVEGVTVEDLRKGPGHYRSTPQPGYAGNAAIAGHRTTYGAPFNRIDELAPGDKITVTTLHGTWNYEVLPAPNDPSSGHFVVSPDDVWVLNDFGDNRLTLTACHPKYSASQRIVVVAKLLDAPDTAPPPTTSPAAIDAGVASGATGDTVGAAVTPAPSPDDPSLDQALGGDPSARTPALVLGLAFFALLAAVWQLSIRWRRWPVYAMAVVPVGLVMFTWFEHLDRWLPAR